MSVLLFSYYNCFFFRYSDGLVQFHFAQKIRKIEIYSPYIFFVSSSFSLPLLSTLPLDFFFVTRLKKENKKWKTLLLLQREKEKEGEPVENVNVRTQNLNVISCTREKWIKNGEMKLQGKKIGNLFNKQPMRHDVVRCVMVACARVRMFDFIQMFICFGKQCGFSAEWQNSRCAKSLQFKLDAQLCGWCAQT